MNYAKILWRCGLVIVWAATPLPAFFLYDVPLMMEFDPVAGASMMLGLEAFAFLAVQILLAGRPLGLDKKVGVPWYNAFHLWAGVSAIILALVHRGIKLNVLGYPEGFQTLWGTVALSLVIVAALGAFIFLYPGLIGKLPWVKKMRGSLGKTGFDYKRIRWIHGLAGLAPLLACVHVLMASSTAVTPQGWWYLCGLVLVGTFFFILYRIRGRKS